MLKIMIVDDEVLSRIALRSMVEDHYSVVAEAANGTDALELAEKVMPDIILVDVVMPGIDGLSFISQISKKLPMTRYIIISNMEQIEYLKKAIKMQVHDYLIKGTLTEELLLSTLSGLSKRILQERQSIQSDSEADRNPYSDTVLAELVDSIARGKKRGDREIAQVFRLYGMDLSSEPYYCLLFHGVDHSVRGVIERILTLDREILRDCGEGVMLQMSQFDIVCFYFPPEGNNPDKAVRDLAYRCVMSNKNIFGVQFIAGISSLTDGEAALQSSYLQADSATKKSFYYTDYAQTIFRYAESEECFQNEAAKVKALVKAAIQDRTVDSLFKTPQLLEELKETAAASRMIPREIIIGLYLDIVCYVMSFIRETEASAFDDLGEALVVLAASNRLEELHKGSMEIVQLALEHYASSKGGNRDIRNIKQYVSDHISEELRIEDIAAHIHVSPNYLTQMFKNETGMTMRDYIAAERISRAKDYLLLGKSLRETAQLTGFSTDSYFVQKFKAAMHMTPKQFQKKNKV